MIKSISQLLFSECLVLVVNVVAVMTAVTPTIQHLTIAIHTVNVRRDMDLQIVQLLAQAGAHMGTRAPPNPTINRCKTSRSCTNFLFVFFCYILVLVI